MRQQYFDQNEIYITNPVLNFHPRIKSYSCSELISNQKFDFLSLRAFYILDFFLGEKTIKEAINNGFSLESIEECIELKFILSSKSDEYLSVSQWEEYNWSRAAFITFSQQNIEYKEEIGEIIPDLTNQRRKTLEEYENDMQYPANIAFQASEDSIELLSKTGYKRISLNKIAARKSCREFRKEKVSYEDFASILYQTTQRIRDLEKTKTNDIFYLLNSFYSWLNLYVVIQNVENLQKGVYLYNPLNNKLTSIKNNIKNSDIRSCVQGQYWMNGNGFCLFFVVQWKRYQWLYRHSRAYLNLLIQLGDICQEFLFNMPNYDLEGWMTPAIKETEAGNLLDLDPNEQEAMYFLKIGIRNGKIS